MKILLMLICWELNLLLLLSPNWFPIWQIAYPKNLDPSYWTHRGPLRTTPRNGLKVGGNLTPPWHPKDSSDTLPKTNGKFAPENRPKRPKRKFHHLPTIHFEVLWLLVLGRVIYFSRWWFQIFFMFTPIWGNDPFWLIFFKWVETTN